VAVVVGAGVTTTLDGAAEEVSDDDGAAEDGAAEDGAAEDGAAEKVSDDDGAAEDGAADDGAAEEVSAEDGDKDGTAELVIVDSYVVVTGVVMVSVEYSFPTLVTVFAQGSVLYTAAIW
jgi:hypothetical protein